MSDLRYRSGALKVPTEAAQVATRDSNGRHLLPDGSALAPQSIVVQPNNASAPQTVSLTSYPTGTRIFVEPTNSPATQNVTITPKGSFVGPTGSAITQCVLTSAGGFAICDIIGGITVLSVYKGATLS